MNFKFHLSNYRLVRLLAVLLIACGSLLTASAQNGGTQQNLTGKAGTFAIVNAKIVTVSGAAIDSGTLVIRNGKIAAFGRNVSIPRGAERIDGRGLSVYPGMIDAGTNMGLQEIGNGVAGTVDVRETGNLNPNAKAILGINPHTSHINITRVNGITTVLSMPRGGLVSGQAAIINLNGSTQAELAIVRNFGLVVGFPTISTFAGFSPLTGVRRINFSKAVKRRDKRVEELKDLFKKVKRYQKVKKAAANDKSLPRPAMDLKMEAMIPYVNGDRPIIFSAQRARDIRGVVKFAEDMKVKAIIYGGAEAWKVADGLKKNKIGVIYNRIYTTPLRADDTYDSLYSAPSKMSKAGISFCISTGDNGANVRDLPYQAGIASSYGLTPEEALKSVTLYPAQILGIANEYGSIEVGKVANIVVTNGDMLEQRTNIKHLFINGRKLPLTSRHTELYEAFKNRK